MFQAATESVLIAGYAVHQGAVLFKELAERMEQNSGLHVQMFLNIHRTHHDRSGPEAAVRDFYSRFLAREWPGRRIPALYYTEPRF